MHWLSFTPLFLSLTDASRKADFWPGWLCGFIGTAMLFDWLPATTVFFTETSPTIAWGLFGLYCAAFAIPYGLLTALIVPLKRRFPNGWVFLLPAAWVAREAFLPSIPPYFHGLSQYRVLTVWQIASVLGPYGVSYLILLSNCFLSETILRLLARKRLSRTATAITLLLFGGTLLYGTWRLQSVEADLSHAPQARIGLVQIKEDMTTRLKFNAAQIYGLFARQTHGISNQPMDLLVWPEGIANTAPDSPLSQKFLHSLARRLETFLTYGTSYFQKSDDTTRKRSRVNEAVLLSPKGEIAATQQKIILVPFGEYVPQGLNWLADWAGLQTYDMTPGTSVTLFHAARFSFTVALCYESIFASHMMHLKDGDVFVALADDGWSEHGMAGVQHAMLASVAATTLGRPLVRSAVNGVNLVVEPQGKVVYETPMYEDHADIVTVRLGRFETAYAAWGWMFPYLCLVVVLAGFLKRHSQ